MSGLRLEVAGLVASLRDRGYIADRGLAVAVYLALALGRPLLLEGEAGVGKTELAKVMGAVLDRPLFRLQCYEGIDRHEAIYDWDYRAQLLESRRVEGSDPLYREEFLLEGPILAAIRSEVPAVLLIDELDRADEEFEAFLLETLGEMQVTIPRLRTVRAKHQPFIVITSNRTRDLHDALRRRCIYEWIDYPDQELERQIVEAAVPGADAELVARIAAAVERLRRANLYKPPGIGESIDWAEALLALGSTDLVDGLPAALKVREDIEQVRRTAVLDQV